MTVTYLRLFRSTRLMRTLEEARRADSFSAAAAALAALREASFSARCWAETLREERLVFRASVEDKI